MVPAEVVQLAYVGEFAQGAIGFGGVPYRQAVEAYGGSHEFGKGANGYLAAAADVDMAVAHLAPVAAQVGEVYMLKAIDAGVGHILAPQELADGFAGAPQRELSGLYAVGGEGGGNLPECGIGGEEAGNGPAIQVGTQLVETAFGQQPREVHLAHHCR